MTRVGVIVALLVTRAASAAPPEPPPERLNRALLGARGPRLGHVVPFGSLGVALILPQLTLGARVGLGAGFYGEAAYANLAVFGHQGRVRFGWGGAVGRRFELGLAAKSSFATLRLADKQLVGISFSALPLGNDWDVGQELALTWNRPGHAHVTTSVGPLFTLGGLRYDSFDEARFRFEPALRGVTAAVQGEWSVWRIANVMLRLDALFLAGVERDRACQAARQDHCQQLVPLGFVPTGTVGVAWGL